MFSRFLNNTIRRKGKGWKEYVDLLEKRGLDMSDHTKTKLAEEMESNGGPNDAVMDNTCAVAQAVLDSVNGKKTTLKPPVISTTNSAIEMDDLVKKFRVATKLGQTQVPTASTVTTTSSPFSSPFSFSTSPFYSPAIQQRLSTHDPLTVDHILADYAHDGSREKPIPVYFNKNRPSHHMGLFIHQAEIPSGYQVIKTTIVQKSGSIGDINNVFLEVAQTVPKCFESYIGRALLFRQETTDCFGRNINAFVDTSGTDPSKYQTATELKKAQVAAHRGENAWTFKLILFPCTQEPFDNRVFSSDDTRVHRESVPNRMKEPSSGKELYGFTSTWKIAHAGQMEDIEMRDDKVDLTSFF